MDENMDIMEPDQQDDEKKFTQSEVDEIVKKRLQRERKKITDEMASQQEEQSAEADLTARETALACKEYLIANHYPLELLDILGTADLTEFKNKVGQLDTLLQPHGTSPVFEAEPYISHGMRNDIRQAFSPEARHKPKSWY